MPAGRHSVRKNKSPIRSGGPHLPTESSKIIESGSANVHWRNHRYEMSASKTDKLVLRGLSESFKKTFRLSLGISRLHPRSDKSWRFRRVGKSN